MCDVIASPIGAKQSTMNILFIGDIYGRPGRRAVTELLPQLIQRHKIDFVVANADNAAGGKGMTDKVCKELFALPIDVITAGNHIWEKDSVFPHLDSHPIVRPHNIEEQSPGQGWRLIYSKKQVPVAVIHLQGRIFMDKKGKKATSPFKAMDEILQEIRNQTGIILVDFHAEATAEKRALSWYLDGKISCLVGTHTHVQTTDEEIMPKGMGYITDLGMTGPHRSVIGLDVDIALKRFLSDGKYKGFKVATEDVRLQGLLVDIHEGDGKARSVQRIREAL